MNTSNLKINIFLLLAIISSIYACKKEQDPFQISKQHIGLLTDSTQVGSLEVIYANDSIVKHVGGDEFIGAIDAIEIYAKGGASLLSLTPSEALDSTATIKTIKVIDPRYKTDKGLTVNSTFINIEDNYTISSIQTTITNIVVFVDEINAFFTIDKNVLPGELRFDSSTKIEAVHIPDDAKIKYFMIGW